MKSVEKQLQTFLVCRVDEGAYNYDQYDSFVVRAYTKREAKDIANEHGCGRFHNAKVLNVDGFGESGVVIGSFNAG